ncbi:hypothetical protein D3C81_1589230 [compost metagenome]
MKPRCQVFQVLGQLEIAPAAAEVEQLPGFGPMRPVIDAVHQQQALQVAAQACGNQFFLDQVHSGDNADRKRTGNQCAHQGEGNDDALGKTLLELHINPRPVDNLHRARYAATACRKACR